MITISSKFIPADYADFALGELKKRIDIENAVIRAFGKSDDEQPVNYPLKPDYTALPQTQYLDGLPHVLDDGPIYSEYFEPEHKTEARLYFCTDEKNKQAALSILLAYKGTEIKVGK